MAAVRPRQIQDASLVESSFSRGIVRDSPRWAIPAGGVYDSLDMLLDRPGVAYKRGGSEFQSGVLDDASPTDVIVVAVGCPEFPNDPRVIAITSNGDDRTLYDVTGVSPGVGILVPGVTNSAEPHENMSMFVDRMILCDAIGDGAGSNFYQPQKIYLSGASLALADLGGSPPSANLSCVHLSYLVLARTEANPNRLFFSPLPDPEPTRFSITAVSTADDTVTVAGDHTDEFYEDALVSIAGSTGNDGTYRVLAAVLTGSNTVISLATVANSTADGTIGRVWDTELSYIDVPTEITGLASINGVLVVFTRGDSWRILGNIPPGITGENMELQPLAAVGCIDARSIVKMNGLVYWAHESGVYYTNAAGIGSITDKQDRTGISKLWASAVAGFSPVLGSVVCAGVWLNQYLFLTVRHTDDDPQEGARYQFLYHDGTKSWTRLSDGVTADMYATRNAPEGEIYAACGDASDPVRLLALSGLFVPTTDNAYDANGDPVEPLLELRPFSAGPPLKSYGHGHVTYDLVEMDGTVPTDWAAITVYATDALVLDDENHVWRASVGGTSGATEPTWTPGSSVTDGSVTWTMNGAILVKTAPRMDPSMFTVRRVLDGVDDITRRRFDTNFDAEAATVRIEQDGVSATTEIVTVEMEVRGYDVGSEVDG